MSNASDFFSGGSSSGGGRADGLPSLPNSAGVVDVTSNARHLVLEGTTDSIRTPNKTNDSNSALGYRRIDKFEAGGASEWIIDWNAVSAFTGWNLATITSGCAWHQCYILDGFIYMGFYDSNNASTTGAGSFLLKANNVTGVIVSVTKITANPVLLSTYYTDRQFKNDLICFFWEINSLNQLEAWYGHPYTISPYTFNGVSLVVYSEDLTTVISENTYFATNLTTTSPVNFVSYVTEDKSLILAQITSAVTAIFVVASGHTITIGTGYTGTLMAGGDLLHKIADSQIAGAARNFTTISDGTVCVRRVIDDYTGYHYSHGAQQIARPYILREDLDNYLKEIVLNFSGLVV